RRDGIHPLARRREFFSLSPRSTGGKREKNSFDRHVLPQLWLRGRNSPAFVILPVAGVRFRKGDSTSRPNAHEFPALATRVALHELVRRQRRRLQKLLRPARHSGRSAPSQQTADRIEGSSDSLPTANPPRTD